MKIRLRVVVTKEIKKTARQWSNAAVKKNYVRAGGIATLGIECKMQRGGAGPRFTCRLLAAEVVPPSGVQLMQRRGQMANR